MAITTKQHGNAVTITIDGKQFETLQRIADALRLLTWAGGDDTPETVCREFVAWGLHDEFDPPGELAAGIAYALDTKAGDDAELDAARTKEVRRVLEEAGLFGNEAEEEKAEAVEPDAEQQAEIDAAMREGMEAMARNAERRGRHDFARLVREQLAKEQAEVAAKV